MSGWLPGDVRVVRADVAEAGRLRQRGVVLRALEIGQEAVGIVENLVVIDGRAAESLPRLPIYRADNDRALQLVLDAEVPLVHVRRGQVRIGHAGELVVVMA